MSIVIGLNRSSKKTSTKTTSVNEGYLSFELGAGIVENSNYLSPQSNYLSEDFNFSNENYVVESVESFGNYQMVSNYLTPSPVMKSEYMSSTSESSSGDLSSSSDMPAIDEVMNTLSVGVLENIQMSVVKAIGVKDLSLRVLKNDVSLLNDMKLEMEKLIWAAQSEMTSVEKKYKQKIENSQGPYEDYLNYHWCFKMEKGEDLHSLAGDFTETAIKFAQVLIFEKNLPNYLKSIKPINIGGKAGGDKFLAHGILFKYAVDVEIVKSKWIYGGNKRSDFLASKALNNEIKSLSAIFKCVSKNNLRINLPLITSINYLGITIAAISLFPLKGQSLVYGTKDAGHTMYNNTDDLELQSIVQSIGNHFGYQEHPVQDGQGVNYNMVLAADVEIHKSEGKFYMLDFGRFLAPSNPMRPFIDFFRPEYLIKNQLGISCDSFSGFGKVNSAFYNDHALQKIEEFLNYIKTDFLIQNEDIISETNITDILHTNGINLRYIGELRQSCYRSDKRQSISKFFLKEMILRSMKEMLKIQLGDLVNSTVEPSEYTYREIVVQFMTKISNKDDEFWIRNGTGSLKSVILSKFGHMALEEKEIDPDYCLLSNFNIANAQELTRFLQRFPDYATFSGGSSVRNTFLNIKTKDVVESDVLQTSVENIIDENSLSTFTENDFWACRQVVGTENPSVFKFLELYTTLFKKEKKYSVDKLNYWCDSIIANIAYFVSNPNEFLNVNALFTWSAFARFRIILLEKIFTNSFIEQFVPLAEYESLTRTFFLHMKEDEYVRLHTLIFELKNGDAAYTTPDLQLLYLCYDESIQERKDQTHYKVDPFPSGISQDEFITTLRFRGNLTPFGLKEVCKLTTLTDLDLSSLDPLPDTVTHELNNLVNLKKFKIDTNMTGISLQSLTGLKNLKEISLTDPLNFEEEHLSALCDNLENLETFRTNNIEFPDSFIQCFTKLKSLTSLSIELNCEMSGAGLVHLADTNITSLRLEYCTKITDENLSYVGQLTRLTRLEFHECEFTEQGLIHLRSLTNLKYLQVTECDDVDIHDENFTYFHEIGCETNPKVLAIPDRILDMSSDDDW